MTRLMKSALAPVVMAAAMGFATTARAQVVVLTAKSAGVLLKDAKTLLTSASPDPNAVKPILDMIDGFQAPGGPLGSIDLTRPVGAYLDLPKVPGAMPTIVAFVPVTDFNGFLQSLQNFGFMVDAKSNAPGFSHTVTPPGGAAPPLMALSASGYAFFTSDSSTLAAIKAMKPAALLPKRAGAGDLTLTINLDRIPEEYKQQALAGAQQAAAAQQEQKPGESDATYKGRVMGAEGAAKVIETLLKDGREISLDLGVDAAKGELAIEFGMTAKPGSTMAGTIKKVGAMKSKFRSLGTGSILAASVAMPMGESARKFINTGLEEGLKKADATAGDAQKKAILNQIVAAIKPTLNADTVDMAMSFQGPFPGKSGGSPTVAGVLAVSVKGGKKIEAALMDAIKAAKPEEKARLTVNFAKAADGTSIHRLKGDEDPKTAQFGEPNLYFAFRDDSMMASFGQNGPDVLKKAMDAPKTPAAMPATGPAAAAPQVELVAALSKFATIEDEKDKREAMTAAAKGIFAGKDVAKDKIRLTLKGEPDAVRLRLSADLPALKFIATIGGVNGKP